MNMADLRQVFCKLPLAAFIFQDNIIKMSNQAMADITGYSGEIMAGMNLGKLFHPKDWPDLSLGHMSRLDAEGGALPNHVSVRLISSCGETIFLRGYFSRLIFEGRGAILCQLAPGAAFDLKERLQVEKALRAANGELEAAFEELKAAEEELLQQYEELRQKEEKISTDHQQLLDVIDFLPDATFVIDNNKRVIAWNRAIVAMTGVPREDMLGKGDYAYAVPFYGEARPLLIDLLFSDVPDEELQKNYNYDLVERKGSTLIGEIYVEPVFNGRGAFLWFSATPLFDAGGNLLGAIETVRDVTGRRQTEERLKFMATHDSLTGIPNRYFLEENLKLAVARSGRGERSALLLIDLDNFKIVNDTLGHPAGDEMLITLVKILNSNLREGDLLARLGGDEFAVLLPGVTQTEAGAVADKLRRVVDEHELYLTSHKYRFNLSISLGVVVVDGTLDIQRVLSVADDALYASKQGGRNRVTILQPGQTLSESSSEANKMVGIIKGALKQNRLLLYFQPVYNLSKARIIHHEALVRLQDQEGRLLPPGKFIPVAERFGLMPQIDRRVVQSTLLALQKYPDIHLFVNLSGMSLGDRALLDFIEEAVRQSGIDPARIGFEITETSAVWDLARAGRWIARLKGMGCRFALDDFGIGFSSFSYLRMLPVDYLKIDGSYVQNIDTDKTQRALVQAMNVVAHTLGKEIIAEFVENQAVLAQLQELNIDCGQGYYLGRPSPIPG